MLRQKQRVAASRTGILYGGTVAESICAVFKNEDDRDGFTGLSYSRETGCCRLSLIESSVVFGSVFDRFLIAF